MSPTGFEFTDPLAQRSAVETPPLRVRVSTDQHARRRGGDIVGESHATDASCSFSPRTMLLEGVGAVG